ncbi:MAG: hypothetical protein DYG92_12830 [Leptolyngbya sp. PLA1]|nr:hypothetical protein [Leptolyngbya sp. PLA1]
MRPLILALVVLMQALAALDSHAQPLRGRVEQRSFVGPVTGRTVNFNVYLPEGYDTSTERYPVVYHLHGIGGNQGGQQNTSVPRAFEAAHAEGLIGKVIIVFPNGYTDAFWSDSIGGDKPAETDLVLQLIPHVDASFRTIAYPGQRIIQGFSMGGFGATKTYAKFPELFAACVEYDGAIVTWQTMLQSHPDLALGIFGNDETYFDQFSPRRWSTDHAPVLRDMPPVRMVVGALVGGNRQFRDYLLARGIPVDYSETACSHSIDCLMTTSGVQSAAFIASHLRLACEPDRNRDGNIDQDDVEYVRNTVAGGENPGGLDPDVNRDGSVDQDDIAAIIHIIAGGPCP